MFSGQKKKKAENFILNLWGKKSKIKFCSKILLLQDNIVTFNSLNLYLP